MTCATSELYHQPWRPRSLIHRSLVTHKAHSDDSDQTGRMLRLILFFSGCTDHLVDLSRSTTKPTQVAQRATIAHLSPMCQGQISFQKIQTHPSFNACSCYMKVSKGSNQKQQRKSGNTIVPIIRSIGAFLRRSRAANSVVGGPIWSKFELIHNIMQQV